MQIDENWPQDENAEERLSQQSDLHRQFLVEVAIAFEEISSGRFSIKNFGVAYSGFDEKMENFQFGIYLVDLMIVDSNREVKTIKLMLTKGTPKISLNRVTGRMGREELKIIQQNNIEFALADLTEMGLDTIYINIDEMASALSIFDPKVSPLKFQSIVMTTILHVKAISAILYLAAEGSAIGRSSSNLKEFREKTYITKELRDSVRELILRLSREEI